MSNKPSKVRDLPFDYILELKKKRSHHKRGKKYVKTNYKTMYNQIEEKKREIAERQKTKIVSLADLTLEEITVIKTETEEDLIDTSQNNTTDENFNLLDVTQIKTGKIKDEVININESSKEDLIDTLQYNTTDVNSRDITQIKTENFDDEVININSWHIESWIKAQFNVESLDDFFSRKTPELFRIKEEPDEE